MAPRIPPVEQQARLKRLRRPAWLIDAAMRIPGTRFRFGLNSLLGLPPAIGDLTLAAVSLYFVHQASRFGLPRDKLRRMFGNVAIEALLGAVPVLGDLLDVVFKANLRNLAVLEEHLSQQGRPWPMR